MKKLLLLPFALISLASFAQQKKKELKVAVDSTKVKATNKYTDNVDDRMKGPNGEKVFIGPSGGRYYMKGDKKVYLATNIKKKKG